MIYSCRIFVFAFAHVCCLGVTLGQFVNFEELLNTNNPVLEEPRKSTCDWEDPPENGFNFKPCSTGICRDVKGSVQKNGTVRFTQCKTNFVMSQGSNKDVCYNGRWTSRGHKCIPCGKSKRKFDPDEDIVLIHAGYNSSRGDFPWMAALYTPLDGGRWEQICGGTLISPRMVLTAAHCFFLAGTQLGPDQLRVGLGKIRRDFYVDEPSSLIVNVQEVIRPDRYEGINHLFDLDIGLLVLEEDVKTHPNLMPACVDWTANKAPRHNEVGYLAGFGVIDSSGTKSTVLKWAYQKYIEITKCKEMTPVQDRKFITQDKFCVAEVKGATADKGDSGGGLTFLRDDTHYVYGVVSTKVNTDDWNLRLFTNVLNDLHRAFMTKNWQRTHADDGYQPNNRPGSSSMKNNVGCSALGSAGKEALGPSYEQMAEDVCKEEHGLLWRCKRMSECPKAVEAIRNERKVQYCNLKSQSKDNPVVCCEPYLKQPPPMTKSQQMCRWFAQSVYSQVVKPGRDEYALTDNCPMKAIFPGTWKETKVGDFPHLAIVTDNNFEAWCYGSLISEKFIMASATCTQDYGQTMKAKVGVRYSTNFNGIPRAELVNAQDMDIVDMVIHPDFDYKTTYNSISLMKLKTSLRFSQFVRPACLHSHHIFPDTKVIAIGERNYIFHQENTTLMPRKECNSAFPDNIDVIRGVFDDSMLCARVHRIMNEIEIYGGMPLQVRLDEPYCMYSLVGVSAFDQGNSFQLNGYMRVSHYLPWIESVVWPK